MGTPGSGKTFSIIEPFIRQHSEKGFAMVVYDYNAPQRKNALSKTLIYNKMIGEIKKIGGHLVTS